MTPPITIEVSDPFHFIVSSDGRSVVLSFDELLAQIVSMCHPDLGKPRYEMRTAAEWEEKIAAEWQRAAIAYPSPPAEQPPIEKAWDRIVAKREITWSEDRGGRGFIVNGVSGLTFPDIEVLQKRIDRAGGL